jgi:hypothetical protein
MALRLQRQGIVQLRRTQNPSSGTSPQCGACMARPCIARQGLKARAGSSSMQSRLSRPSPGARAQGPHLLLGRLERLGLRHEVLDHAPDSCVADAHLGARSLQLSTWHRRIPPVSRPYCVTEESRECTQQGAPGLPVSSCSHAY